MKISCYTITHNEELILPHFINHYKKFCDKIVVYNNMSTDNTKQIALDHGCEVIDWEADGGGLNDGCHIDIKSNCYKKDRDTYDWVIAVDCDEFYTHAEGVDKFISVLENYKTQGITLPKIQGYEMVGNLNLNLSSNIFSIDEGVKSTSYSKRCIFNPKLNMNWHYGCHPIQSAQYLTDPLIRESNLAEIILLHYKFINLDYVLNRHKCFSKRLSSFNNNLSLGYHYNFNFSQILDLYNELNIKKEKVILKV